MMRTFYAIVFGLLIVIGSVQATDRRFESDDEIKALDDGFKVTPPEPRPAETVPASRMGVVADRIVSYPRARHSDVEYSPGMEGMPNPYIGSQPIRIIGHLIAAPPIDVASTGSVSRKMPIHPDEIDFHFSSLAELLASSGLSNESREVLKIQEQFQRDGYPRLLIAQKELQLQTLQAEIDTLKRQLNEIVEVGAIELDVNIVEVSCDSLHLLAQEIQGAGLLKKAASDSDQQSIDEVARNVLEVHGGTMEIEGGDIGRLLNQLESRGVVSFLSRPKLRTLDGQEACVEVGMRAVAIAGEAPADSKEFSGTSLTVLPTIVEGKLRMLVTVEQRVAVGDEPQVQGTSGIRKRRMETLVEISSGNSIAVISGRQTTSDSGLEEKSLLVTITGRTSSATTAEASRLKRNSTMPIPRMTSVPEAENLFVPTY